MYKAKIINLDGIPEYSTLHSYKIGDIITIADIWIKYYTKNLKILEHYKIVTKSKIKCKLCGHYIIKKEKVVLNY